LLGGTERVTVAARVAVNRRIRTYQRELELGDGATEHAEGNRSPCADFGKQFVEQAAVLGRCVQTLQYCLAYRLVAKPRCIGRRDRGALTIIELIESWAEGARRSRAARRT